MRTAVVGANFLGCATAFYLRRALEANAKDASRTRLDELKPDEQPEDDSEIIIFEQMSRPGGYKFCTLSLDNDAYTAPCGTASGLDVASAPVFSTLLRDANIPPPDRQRSQEWAIFDWNADTYLISKRRSRLVSFIRSSPTILALLQLFALYSLFFFGLRLYHAGLYTFVFYLETNGSRSSYIWYSRIIWFFFAGLLTFGIVPTPILFRFYGFLLFHLNVRILASVLYGAPTLSSVRTLADSIREQLELIVTHNSASSCITLGHLLSACGLAKFVKQTTVEMLNPMQIQEPFLTQCLSAPMALFHADSSVTPTSSSNALTTLLTIACYAPIPASLRFSSRYMSASDTKALCPTLIEAARADLQVNTRVVSVMKDGTQYKLEGIINGERKNLGTFDAVLLAAVMDPDDFTSDVLDTNVTVALSLPNSDHTSIADNVVVVNTVRFVALVKGDINPSFFGLSSVRRLSAKTYVLNSINCAEIVHIADNVWRVASGERPEAGSNLFRTVFTRVDDVVWLERPPRRYNSAPLRNVSGAAAPSLILNTRFINVATVDRVCNDVNIDCLSARNAASLFRKGVATWI